MDSWRRTRIISATGAAAAVLALGVAGAGAHATSGPDASAPPWMAGPTARSEALNQMYGLGEYATADVHGDAPTWACGPGAYSSTTGR